jgi:hypothetical protein
MRTPAVRDIDGEAGLAAKLEDEAAAWRKSRPAQERFSLARVQVVRIPKRRIARTAISARPSRP